jgi:hypothetical protein
MDADAEWPGSPPLARRGRLRSGGENGTSALPGPPFYGSPPLARIGQEDLLQLTDQVRLTSVGAERTRRAARPRRLGTAHLRLRREDHLEAGILTQRHESSSLARRGRERYRLRPLYGSPPLVRRVLPGRRRQDRLSRLTSARAERAPTTRAPRRRRTAHLRSRGEDAPRNGSGSSRSDSPPLARRGRFVLRSRGQDELGVPSTDVDAGSPPLAQRGQAPRLVTCPSCGSPLLARRGQLQRGRLPVLRRLTPLVRRGLRPPGGDRPARRPTSAERRGPFDLRSGVTGLRLTSAHAERTRARPPASRPGPAHLRSRGEDRTARFSAGLGNDSPPLARRGRPPDPR